jgi:transposase
MQDRDGAKRPLLWTRLDHPGVQKVWADQGFAGRLVEWAAQILGRDLEIVRKDPAQRGFQVQPKRWAVERTFSWLTAHRRLARDYETSPAIRRTSRSSSGDSLQTSALLVSTAASRSPSYMSPSASGSPRRTSTAKGSR